MAGFSDYLEAKVLDHVFRNTAYTPPSTVYLGLHTVAPGDSGGGTEVTGGSYARQAITFGAAATVGGVTSMVNSAQVNYPQATAAWGTIVGGGIYDAASAGNLLAPATFSASKVVGSGDTFYVAAGDVTLRLD